MCSIITNPWRKLSSTRSGQRYPRHLMTYWPPGNHYTTCQRRLTNQMETAGRYFMGLHSVGLSTFWGVEEGGEEGFLRRLIGSDFHCG